MTTDLFVAIDFDGTIVDQDITDAVIQKFARPGWEIPERLWESGQMGSRECLEIQMSLINKPVMDILQFIDRFEIDPHFIEVIDLLNETGTPFAIVSDGFKQFIERLLVNAGFKKMPPVYANGLIQQRRGLKTVFPYANRLCPSGTCKCTVTNNVSGGRSVILIGDGRSDFCLAQKAAFIFSKGKLGRFCVEHNLRFRPFDNFFDVAEWIKQGIEIVSASSGSNFINTDKDGQPICNLVH
jgi:2-hydroxy-3-keto-5-methylthiopentenyl-1-phosphate phosphatase